MDILIQSRAHTIVTVTLIQKYKNDAGQEMAKTSIIYLVDLGINANFCLHFL